MTARLVLNSVMKRFGKTIALDHIDLTVDAGNYCVLLGPSGCGKTTLLNILGGFADPEAGSVMIGEREMRGVPPAKRPTTTVFQDYALFPHMNLIDNVAFGLRMRGTGRRERQEKARAMLEMVGLPDAWNRRPAALSGGQRQRVALARALAVDPDVLLLDEPLGALDLNLRRSMQEELKNIQRRVGATFVHVTHDQEEAMAIADQIVVMNKGRIEDNGPPARVYRAPSTSFTASFLGEMNFLPAICGQASVDCALGSIAADTAGFETGEEVSLCLRPEHFSLNKAGSIGQFEIVNLTFQGPVLRVEARKTDDPDLVIVARLADIETLAVGDTIGLDLDVETPVLIAKEEMA